MKTATAITVFHDAVGARASITYSEIDEQGKVIADNKRVDVVIVDKTAKSNAEKVLSWAQEVIDTQEA